MTGKPRTRSQYARHPNIAAYMWQIERDGLVVAAEYDPRGVEYGFGNALKLPKPYTWRAIPYRPGFHAFTIDVLPGTEPIWLHDVRLRLNLFSPAAGNDYHEALIVGIREQSNGRETCYLVLPSGEVAFHESVEQARHAFNPL